MNTIDLFSQFPFEKELRDEITHQKLAGEIGTAREVISRLLKQMEKDNLIALERVLTASGMVATTIKSDGSKEKNHYAKKKFYREPCQRNRNIGRSSRTIYSM